MRTPQDHLDFMQSPDRWPQWTLPLKRYLEKEHRMEFATLAETEVAGVFRFVPEGGNFEELDEVGDSALLKTLVERGWRVD